MQVEPVMVAISSISAIGVGQSTLQHSVPPLTSSALFSRKPDQQLLHKISHSKPVTPVKVDRLNSLLNGYCPSLAHYLVTGFTFGFCTSFLGERCAAESPNFKSALQQPLIVQSKLQKECEAGRIVGLFLSPPFQNFVCSPLDIVPKKDPSEFRLIHHLSYPDGSSVNNHIPHERSSVHYTTISDAILVIKQAGAGCFMAKTDVKSAFRIIPIHPSDFPLLGMKWDNQYYFDRCLAMGLSSSCAIF